MIYLNILVLYVGVVLAAPMNSRGDVQPTDQEQYFARLHAHQRSVPGVQPMAQEGRHTDLRRDNRESVMTRGAHAHQRSVPGVQPTVMPGGDVPLTDEELYFARLRAHRDSVVPQEGNANRLGAHRDSVVPQEGNANRLGAHRDSGSHVGPKQSLPPSKPPGRTFEDKSDGKRVTFEDKDNKGFVTVKPSGPPPPPSKEIFEAYASKTKITTAVGKGGPSGIDKPKDKGKQVVKTDGTDHLAAIRTGVTLKALGDRAKSEEPQGDFMEELRKAQSKRLKKPDPVEGGVLGPIKKSPDLPPPRGPSTSKAGPSSSGLKSAIPGPSSSGGSTIPGPSSSGLGPPPPPTMRIEDWESNKTKKIPLVGKVDLAGDISGTKLNSAQDNKIDKGKQIVKPQDDFMGTLKDNLTRKLKPVSTGEREKPLEKENPTPTSTIVSNQEMLRTALLLASKKVQKGDVDDEIGDDQDDDESEVEKQKPKPEDNKADKVKDNTARDLLKNIVGTMATVEIDDKKEAGIEDETWT